MNDWLDGVKRFVDVQRNVSEEAAYQAGVDCARSGPNKENCHFRHFSHSSLTQAWERGKRDGAG